MKNTESLPCGSQNPSQVLKGLRRPAARSVWSSTSLLALSTGAARPTARASSAHSKRFAHVAALRAFSLIELIGVLAVITVLASLLLPVVVRHVDIAAVNGEAASLNNISNALVLQILRSNSIPSEAAWFQTVGNWLSYSSGGVLTNARRNLRVCLYDPSGWLTNFVTTSYVQGPTGISISPANARVLFVSSLGKALPSTLTNGTATDFNNLWNSTARTVPTSGPWSGWTTTGKPDDVLVQTLNLQPLFYQLVLSSRDTNTAASFLINGVRARVVTNGTPFNAWYVSGSWLACRIPLPANFSVVCLSPAAAALSLKMAFGAISLAQAPAICHPTSP